MTIDHRLRCTRAAARGPPRQPQRRAVSVVTACAATPNKPLRVDEFIKNECPVRGYDGIFRERPRQATHTLALLPLLMRPGRDSSGSSSSGSSGSGSAAPLMLPGEMAVLEIPQQVLPRIERDAGAVIVCALCEAAPGDDSSAPLSLQRPRTGSWACLAAVAGVQRLPGGSDALVRVLAADRVAVQALQDTRGASVGAGVGSLYAEAALLRDRWAYMVRLDALEQHLGAAVPAASMSTAGRDIINAISQIEDAVQELRTSLQDVVDTVRGVADGGDGALARALDAHGAAGELETLASWCELQGPLDGGGEAASSELATLLERAWRLSFAPLAARGLAAALGADPSVARAAAMESMDLGRRIEDTLEYVGELKARLAIASTL